MAPEAAPPDGLRGYLRSGWVRTGLALLVLGSGPLLLVVVAAALGVWPDPHPNPVGLGLLAFVTFWPAVACLARGVFRVRRHRAASSRNLTP